MKSPVAPVVLLVENDPVWATLLTDLLQHEGARVLGPAATAAQARALCQAPHPTPTLAVLDIGLDGPEDGLALGHWLQQQHGLPLCYCTSHAEPTRFAQARATAPLAYVCKSAAPAELRHQLVLALDQAARRPAPAPALPPRLWLPHQQGLCCVAVAELLYAAADARHRTLYSATDSYPMARPLRQLLVQLQPYGFVQVHRSYLLNPAHAWRLTKDRDELVCGARRVPLGEHYRDELLRSLPLLR